MAITLLTDEQQSRLDEHIAGIGHNRGPELVEQGDKLLEGAARHHRLRGEITRLRVMLDMLRSHFAGERLMPARTTGYVVVGLSLAVVIADLAIATQPIAAVLLDTAVLGAVFTALHGEVEQYAYWRAERDPAYQKIKQELSGA